MINHHLRSWLYIKMQSKSNWYYPHLINSNLTKNIKTHSIIQIIRLKKRPDLMSYLKKKNQLKNIKCILSQQIKAAIKNILKSFKLSRFLICNHHLYSMKERAKNCSAKLKIMLSELLKRRSKRGMTLKGLLYLQMKWEWLLQIAFRAFKSCSLN